jgi:hypothetical protein
MSKAFFLLVAVVGVAMTSGAVAPMPQAMAQAEAKDEAQKLDQLHYVTKDGKVVSPSKVHQEIDKLVDAKVEIKVNEAIAKMKAKSAPSPSPSKPEPKPVKPPQKICCKAMTASCMSCAAGVSIEKFCSNNPKTVGCAKPAPKPAPVPAPTSQCTMKYKGMHCGQRKYIGKQDGTAKCAAACKSKGYSSNFITFAPETRWKNDCICTLGNGMCSSRQRSHDQAYHIYECRKAALTPAPKPVPKPQAPKAPSSECTIEHRGKHCNSRRYYGKNKGSVRDCYNDCKQRGNKSPFVTYNPNTKTCVCTTGDGKCSSYQDSHMKQYHIYKC